MIWKFNDDYRDEFSKGPHRDILIVPHATKVTPVPGGPPNITNRRPIFDWDENTEKYYPRKEGNNFVLDDVDWVIDNSVLVKEKFKYHYSLNSEQNLTFSSCNAAMVQFTIRNKKEYVEELDENDQPTGNWYWEQEIPNLYKQEFTKKNPNGTERIVTGEVLSHACIEVYEYFNGDSSSLIYLGMFTVEEDKLVDNGYNRQITAYDFMATFRDMDIFNWYQNLFKGINKLDNQFEDATNNTGEETTKPDDYDNKENWVREKREKWTIGEALDDLITNLASYDMCTWEKVETDEMDPETGEKKTIDVMTKGMTTSNPNDYGRDGYPEGNGYSGFGMPIMLDPDLFDKSKKYDIPTETGDDKKECYGYMDILELEFYQNPKIMKAESLSMGKFLEDIGMLAGRYPYIRLDGLDEHDYFDPESVPTTGEHAYDTRYNNYERCILTFKPLPSSKDDKDVSKVPEMEFSNHELAKGFQHEYCDVEDIMIFKIPLDDGTEIEYKRLTKEQRVAAKKSQLQTFTMPDNMFASYLVTKSDDDEVKKMLEKYKVIREDLFGTETSNGNMSSGAKFQQGYLNMKYRTYTPFQLTTYADPVRECGDRILINFEDKITGEVMTFYSYILERDIEGIQKQMDTYTANGTVRNPIFSSYQAGKKSGSGSGNQNGQDSGLMTPFDLIEYMRNCGYRLLDEPSDCSAKFSKGGESGDPTAEHYFYATSGLEDETGKKESYIRNGDTTNPISVWDTTAATETVVDIDVTPGDYVYHGTGYNHDDPIVPSFINQPLYVYTLNSEWKYVGNGYTMGNGGCNFYDASNAEIILNDGTIVEDGADIEGKTDDTIIIKPIYYGYYYKYRYTNTSFYRYASEDWGLPYTTKEELTTSASIKVEPGDTMWGAGEWYCIYQYPGVWVHLSEYPKLDIPVAKTTKPYIELKWSDPPDITDWKPTPATWEGTVIIRKEDSAPLHRWDGEKIVGIKTRDKYKTKPYKDEDIKMNKTYYYGFFPYYTADDSDPEHPIRFYTFTKVIKVETGDKSVSSTIDSIDVSGNTVTIHYTLSKPDVGQFTNIKIYGKIGSNPACDDTDDIIVDVDDFDSSSKDISNLEYESTYYFCLVTKDTNDEELSSNVESCELVDPVPPELKPYISKMNDIATWKFAWANIPSSYYKGYPSYTTIYFRYPATNYSYSGQVYASTYAETLQYYNGGMNISHIRTYNILTLNVTKNNATSYTGRIDFPEGSTGSIYNIYNPTSSNCTWVSIELNSVETGSIYDVYRGNTGDGDTTVDYVTYTGTLEQVFSWYSDRFRNVNIYVDGIQYAKSHYRLV